MIPAQNTKYVCITPPAAILDAAAATTAEIDTKGYAYLEIFMQLGATDIAVASCTVTESDTTGSNHAAFITVGTTADVNGVVTPLPGALDDNKLLKFEIDLRGRKRFIDSTFTAGDGTAGTYFTAWAILHRASDPPVTASERGIGTALAANSPAGNVALWRV